MRIFGNLPILILMVMNRMSSSTSLDQPQVTVGVSSMDIGHAKNVLRAKSLILRESGMSEDDLPVIRPERKARVQAAFNDSDDGFAFYNEEDAFEVINFIGHNRANSSEIFFEVSDKMRKSRIESASLSLYLRSALSPQEQRAIVEIKDQENNLLSSTTVVTPNAPTKMYRIQLDSELLQRALRDSGPENFLSLKIRAEAMQDASDDLVMVKGRLGHMPHMGVVLAVKFPSAKLLARRRSRRSSIAEIMRGQCEEGQTSCCPHIQVFSWEELGFNHIVAPLKFHSVICRGTCHDYAYSPGDFPRENIVPRDYKHQERRQLVVQKIKTACCHPDHSMYESQVIIWMGKDDEVIKREIPNFYATRCICD